MPRGKVWSRETDEEIEHLRKALAPYGGKWVLVVNNEVVLAHEDPKTLRRLAAERGIRGGKRFQLSNPDDPETWILPTLRVG